MNIGIDIDDTITEMPEFFSVLTKAFRASGHKIHLISYRSQDYMHETKEEMASLNVEYDTINLSVGQEGIPEFKSRVAISLDIDVMIDDMPEALSMMPSKVKRLWLCDELFYPMKDILKAFK